jgi:quercetin dioxygenase-like cupin family protein
MKRITQDLSLATPSPLPIFVGEVATQDLVCDADAELLRLASVTFRNGARNRFHTHTCDQVLVVTHGLGIVATESDELRVSPGDVILIPAGELHWHGAQAGSDFTHLSIVTPNEMQISEDEHGAAMVQHGAAAGAR